MFFFEVLSPVSHERWRSDEDNRKFGTEVNQNLFPLHGSGSCFTEPADHEGKAVQYVMLRVNGCKRIITIWFTDQIIHVTVFGHDSMSITHDQYFSQVFKFPKTFWMWCLPHQKCQPTKSHNKIPKSGCDALPKSNQPTFHPKKMGPFFPTGGCGFQLNRLPGSLLEDVARLGLFAHGERKEGWPGRELAGIGADRISAETVTCLDMIWAMCLFFFGGEKFLIWDMKKRMVRLRGFVINYYGSCMDSDGLFQFF